MTNDQAIQVALEAAVRAVNHESGDECAAAIAAFLRALPVGSGKGMFEFGDDDDVRCLSMKEAAAAVERAASAGEDGHG